jgi:hypothetical protein
MLQVGQSIERQFVSKNVALFRLWHSHLCDAILGSKVGHCLEDSETDEERNNSRCLNITSSIGT